MGLAGIAATATLVVVAAVLVVRNGGASTAHGTSPTTPSTVVATTETPPTTAPTSTTTSTTTTASPASSTTTAASTTTTTVAPTTTSIAGGDLNTVVGGGFSQDGIDTYLEGCIGDDAGAAFCLCTINQAQDRFSEAEFVSIAADDAALEEALVDIAATCIQWIEPDGTVPGTDLVIDSGCEEPTTGILVPYPNGWFTHRADCQAFGPTDMAGHTRREAREAAAFTFSISELIAGEVDVAGGSFEDAVDAFSPIADLYEYSVAGRQGYIVIAEEFGEPGQVLYGYVFPLDRDDPRSSAVFLAAEGFGDDPAFGIAVDVIDAVVEAMLFQAE